MPKICLGCMEMYGDSYQICPTCGYAEGTRAKEALHMEPGNILRGRYIVGKVLGFGGFGVTYIGWDSVLEKKVAIKEYLPSEFSTRIPGQTLVTVFNGDKAEQFIIGLKKFIDEAQRLVQFHSLEGIVKIFDTFTDNNTAYIIMEYLEGETLAALLKRRATIPYDEAVAMLIPVIRSLRAVHEMGIIHRDIAPDNIFLTSEGKTKLIDFGAARFATTSVSRSLTVIIKPGYSPEEQYRSRGEQGAYTDVYAIGATLYRMITGIVPTDALERRAYFESKQKDVLVPVSSLCKGIPPNVDIAIQNALNVRVEDRTTDMGALEAELLSESPITRKDGKIKKIDVLTWPIWAKIATIAAALMIVLLGTLIAFRVIHSRQVGVVDPQTMAGMAYVPDLISAALESAEQRLVDASLLYTVVGKEVSDEIPADLVLSQNPKAGSIVLQNSIIELTISAGYDIVTADVQFYPEEEARNILENLGYNVGIIYEASETVAEGLVISQSPTAQDITAHDTKIVLVVSTGAAPFNMPDVRGEDEETAWILLTDMGLTVSISYELDSGAEEGIVMRQSVAANKPVKRGDNVTITVSSGEDLVELPDVTELTEEEALEILSELGFVVSINEENDNAIEAGKIISQLPPAGTAQIRGTQIVLTVSLGRAVQQRALTSIEVTQPGKTQYIIGESYSTNGMLITAKYNNGTTRNVTASCTISGFDSSTLGNKTLTVSYYEGGVTRTAQISISVAQLALTRIDVSPPSKKDYVIGESLETGGMSVTAVYNNNATKDVTASCSVSGFDSSTSGSKTITVSYSEGGITKTAQFAVTVRNIIMRLDITPPTKTNYNHGEEFSMSGMIVAAVYSDNTTKNVTGSCTISGFDSSTSGGKEITVSYTEDGVTRTAKFYVWIYA
ncbi:MAG: PASTA domain-containing protein [Oscillospiraceae bacterium]|nr:PASTA domain-containing protein [Oscillospiraceae bacterium]